MSRRHAQLGLLRVKAVIAVADDGKAHVFAMDAYLVGAARFQPAEQTRHARTPGLHLPMGNRGTSSAHDGHARAFAGGSADRRIDSAGPFGDGP